MQYNFRGKYSSTSSYAKKDVVSYQSPTGQIVKYFFCLTDHTNQLPSHNGDSQYWGLINTLSNFPNSIDTFLHRTNIQASDIPNVQRFQELTLKTTLIPTEQDELSALTQNLRNKLILPEDFNALQQSVINLQMFFSTEIITYIQSSKDEITQTKDNALISIENKKQNIIEYMDSTTAGQIRNDIGIKGELSTNDKSSLVNALNEVNAKEINSAQEITKIKQDVTQIQTLKTNFNDHKNDYVAHPGIAITTNTGNAYAVSLNPAPASYVNGMGLILTINADATGAATIKVNTLGVIPVKKANGNAVTNLKANGVYTLRYSTSQTAFILQGEGGEYGAVTEGDVWKGVTFGTEDGIKTGTLAGYKIGSTVEVSNLSPAGFHEKYPSSVDTIVLIDSKKGYYIGANYTTKKITKYAMDGKILASYPINISSSVYYDYKRRYLFAIVNQTVTKISIETMLPVWVKTYPDILTSMTMIGTEDFFGYVSGNSPIVRIFNSNGDPARSFTFTGHSSLELGRFCITSQKIEQYTIYAYLYGNVDFGLQHSVYVSKGSAPDRAYGGISVFPDSLQNIATLSTVTYGSDVNQGYFQRRSETKYFHVKPDYSFGLLQTYGFYSDCYGCGNTQFGYPVNMTVVPFKGLIISIGSGNSLYSDDMTPQQRIRLGNSWWHPVDVVYHETKNQLLIRENGNQTKIAIYIYTVDDWVRDQSLPEYDYNVGTITKSDNNGMFAAGLNLYSMYPSCIIFA